MLFSAGDCQAWLLFLVWGFFEAEISVFLNVYYFVPVLEGLGLNLDGFIIDSMG